MNHLPSKLGVAASSSLAIVNEALILTITASSHALCFRRSNVDRVTSFLYLKLESPPVQWRRILKSLTAIEFIIKNGSPPVVIQFKRDMYKISTLCNFSYNENGMERGNSVREKVNLIVDMLSQEQRLY